jgi:voltage-gated potassium channel
MLENTSGQYIVCGAGRVGRSVIHELLRSEASVVVIDNNAERARWATDKGVITLVGDATKDEILRQARIDTAKGLVAAISSDAENVYVTLSAKVLNPNLIVAARASDEQAEEKLRRAGATTVFTPYSFIGHRLAQVDASPSRRNFSGCGFGVPAVFGSGPGNRTTAHRPVQSSGIKHVGAVAAGKELRGHRSCRSA